MKRDDFSFLGKEKFQSREKMKIILFNPSRKQNRKMKFLGFSKIWRRFLENIFHFKNFFFFLKKIIFKKSSPDFGKPQKFHDFVFSSPEFKQKSFPPEKDSTSPGERSGEFKRFHFNQTFSPTNFETQSSP